MLLGNESLFESQYRYCVIEFLGRPRIHATKRDDCQRDDGRLILQTETDFRDSSFIRNIAKSTKLFFLFERDHPFNVNVFNFLDASFNYSIYSKE